MYDAGFIYLGQLFGRNGQLLQWNEVKNRGVPDYCFLKWYGIVSSLPKRWKQFVDLNSYQKPKGDDHLFLEFKGKSYHLNSCKCKNISKCITNIDFIQPRSELYFSNLFGEQINMWESIYNRVFYLTIDTNLRNFQWKLVHNIIYTT